MERIPCHRAVTALESFIAGFSIHPDCMYNGKNDEIVYNCFKRNIK